MNYEARMHANVLVIGSGLAGLLSAVDLCQRGLSVTLVTKGQLEQSNSSMAQGGVAALASSRFESPLVDSFDQHLVDTIKSGAGLTDPIVASEIIAAAPNLISYLSSVGVNFDRLPSGGYERALEGGHSHARVLHVKDATGKAITSALITQIRLLLKTLPSRLQIIENAFVRELFVKNTRCTGALLSLDSGLQIQFFADNVILATGGSGQLFSSTTNPSVATADGLALAFRAGARLVDMEFFQFHPTALKLKGAPSLLISEAVRGAGAVLIDKNGKRFARDFHPDGELATRDIVARAIQTTMLKTGSDHVFLDFSPVPAEIVRTRFPNILADCLKLGIDPLKSPIPVAPAAHYFMGGVWTDINARTTIDHLYAVGECAATGLHGSNRLASNSLLEAGCMAMRVSRFIAETSVTKALLCTVFAPDKAQKTESGEVVRICDWSSKLQTLMYQMAGLVRTEKGLTTVLRMIRKDSKMARLRELSDEQLVKSNLLLISELIVMSALERKESRGAHFRSDYPSLDTANFGRRLAVTQTAGGFKFNWLELRSPKSVVKTMPSGTRVIA